MILYEKHPSLEDITKRFKAWRLTRKCRSRIPEELWDAAAALSEQHSLHRIATTLRLNHSSLRDHVAARIPEKDVEVSQDLRFLELPSPQQSPQSEYLIEMENRNGEKIRMHFAGEVNLDLFALSQNFWGERS